MASEHSLRVRRVAAALEPVIGQVYFSPECHRRYEALGFDPSPGAANGVALPDGPAYFTSRGSLMGQVAGQVVASAFAVFNPTVVDACVTLGWQRTEAATIRAERERGAVEQLQRILGEAPEGLVRAVELLERAAEPLRPEGKPLFAGARSHGLPDEPLARLFRLGDQLREYRGDVHTIAWVDAELDAVQIGLLTELYWGLPLKTYIRTRAWSEEELDAGVAALQEQRLVDADGGFTEAGRQIREMVEVSTDRMLIPASRALGDDLDELCEILEPWGAEVRRAGGYPASGPHDLAAGRR